jgi:hypothetical protein
MRRRRGAAHEVLVPSEEDGVEHGFVEEEVAHPLERVGLACQHVSYDNRPWGAQTHL